MKRLSCRSLLWILPAVAALLILALSAAFRPAPAAIDRESVRSIEICLESSALPAPLEAHVEDSEQFDYILELEQLIRKNSGLSFSGDRQPWFVQITFHMADGSQVSRSYRGSQKYPQLELAIVELLDTDIPY